METEHLGRLGARPVARETFIEHVRIASTEPAIQWETGWIDHLGVLHHEQH
jgi:leucyl/phenylalanyl-tRNA--protein transferase